MRAAVMRDQKLVVDDVPTPEPGPGEVLVKTLACGICGSDLHALKHAQKLVEISEQSGGVFNMDLTRDIVMGHEFCVEVLDHGPETGKTLKAGSRACSMPVLIRPAGVETVGYSNDHPGGYGELMRLTEGLLLEVPNGLGIEYAALTEPLAVGYHAVQMAAAGQGRRAAGDWLWAGRPGRDCGPLCASRMSGPSWPRTSPPRRRQLAEAMGADVVIDPHQHSPLRQLERGCGGRPRHGAPTGAVGDRSAAAPSGPVRVCRRARGD